MKIMKTRKIIVIAAIITTLSLMFLNGCSDESQMNEYQTNKALSIAPLSFEINDSENVKDMILKKLHKIRDMTEEEYITKSNYSSNKVIELEEFYTIDSLKFDAYELQNVTISETLINFRFDTIQNEGNISLYIGIRRTDHESTSKFFNNAVEQAEEQGWGYLTDDNMLYSENGSLIVPFMDTCILISAPTATSQTVIDELYKMEDQFAPDEFNRTINEIIQGNKEIDELVRYEYMRNLALRVIDTAELVKVTNS